MKRLCNAVVIAMWVAWAAPAETAAEAFPWRYDLNAARVEAAQTGRLLLVHFGTKTCPPCRRLEQTVFSQTAVGQAISTNYVPVKIDADEERQLAETLGVQAVPNDVIITPAGQVVESFVSPKTPDAYVARMAQIAARMRVSSAAMPAQQIAQNGPGIAPQRGLQPPGRPQPPVNSGYANLAAAADGLAMNTRPVTPAATAMPVAAGGRYAAADGSVMQSPSVTPAQATAMPVAVGGRYAAPPQMQMPVGGTAGSAPGIGGMMPPKNAVSGPPQVNPTTPANQVADMRHRSNVARPEAPQIGAANQIPQDVTAQSSVAQNQPTGPPEPPAPLGLDGYCPVTLRNSPLPPNDPRRWVRGDPRWGWKHRGRTYLFAGKAERDLFWHSPDTYAPALSGLDPVLAFTKGEFVQGQRAYGVWYGGLVYTFSSEETLAQFSQNPAIYAAGVRQAMSGGRPTAVR